MEGKTTTVTKERYYQVSNDHINMKFDWMQKFCVQLIRFGLSHETISSFLLS